jgi:predicted 3-demethylubiquinone-9 3-methyltransferase (glyoxalase superfamily)
MQSVTVRSETQCQIDDYHLQVEGEGDSVPHCNWCVDLSWILHFTLHDRISRLLRDALPMSALLVITSHKRVLKYDTHE